MSQNILLKNLARFIELTPEEIEYLLSVLQVKKLRKRQYLLQEGDVCRFQGFVVKGCLRVYEADEKGAEHIVQFAPEDWWVGDLYSFYTGEKSQFNIEALEDSELYVFDNKNLEDLYAKIPKMERYFRLLMQNALIALSRRVLSSMSKSAAERYSDFIQRYPQIEQRVPNHQIASYLGIKPESLSRIRRQQSQKK
ncbi:MAG TPA: Crp/Fnr family transcriptional regulator [Chitinophagales bacterium]|jgi:CRP-like cAMP-binding protein|nr:Crp/Fnr family transcriptional regulator [Chitinophagales bacterium]